MKIIGEIEESKENSTIEKKHLWNSWSSEKGDNLKIRMDKALEHFWQKYQEGELFSVSKIEDAKTLEEIVAKLNPLSLVETEREVKGEAFEYFLQRYNAGEKDLGEYFTPRHVIRNLVAILQPRFKEKVYDPFCGTGGMLIECFKYVSERIKLDPQNKEILTNCFYGNEITNVARITKMNMILFGDGHNNIQRRDTFQFPVKEKYDLIITNIPFGFSDIEHGHLYPISCKYGDCLSIQHCLMACKENGRVAMIMPEGFFTQKIKKYQDTKKWIIQNYSIQAIISLPKGTFLPYTGSKSSVIIMEKKKRSKDYFYYYQIKNDGFTLNNHRDRTEGVNDWDILVSAWKGVVIEEKSSSSLFTKIYYKNIEENDYNLLTKSYNFPLPKDKEKDYLSLSEIANIFRGSSLKRTDFVSNSSYKVWQQKNVVNDDFSWSNNFITDEKFKTIKNKLEIDDILITLDGTVGEVVLCSESIKKGIPSSHLAIIRVKQEYKTTKILPGFLLAIFETPQMKEKLMSQSSGTIFPGLSLDNLKKNLIPVPSLEEQNKIIAGLSKINQSIQNAQQIVDNLRLPLFVSLMKPEETEKLGNLATFEYGYTATASSQGEFRYIRITDIDKHGNISDRDKKYVDLENEADKEKYLLKEKDLIVARTGSVGRTTIFQNKEKSIFASYLIRINLNKEVILPEYYWCFAQTSEYWNQVNNLVGGTAQPQFNANVLKEIRVPIPSLENQKKAVEQMNKIKANYQNISQTIDNLNSSLSLCYENKKIRDICLINPSKSEIKAKQSIEVSFLPMEDCEANSLYVKPTKTKKIEEIRNNYTYFAENDLLIAKITPCFENGKMSIAKNLKNNIGFGSTEFMVLRAKGEVLIEWVYYCLRNSRFLEEGKSYMTGTTGRQRLRQEFVENYLIPLPPLKIQEKLVEELKEEQEIISCQKRSIELLNRKKARYLEKIW